MIKKTTAWIVLIYALLLISLGLWGYMEKGSIISLIMGGGFGLLILLSSILIFTKKPAGAYAAAIFTLILTATFAARFSVTSRPLPAIMAVLSGGMLLFLLAIVTKWKD